MSLDPKFRTIGSFDADKPEQLGRQIQALEDNVSAALGRSAAQALAKLSPTNRKTAAYVAALGELVIAAGTFTVTLPVSSSKNQGELVGVVVESGTITAITPGGTVQGGTSDSLPASGLFLYESTGTGWWRQGGVTSLTAADGTIVVSSPTGAVTIRVGTITSANVDDTIVADADLQRVSLHLAAIRRLLTQIVRVEMGMSPGTGLERVA